MKPLQMLDNQALVCIQVGGYDEDTQIIHNFWRKTLVNAAERYTILHAECVIQTAEINITLTDEQTMNAMITNMLAEHDSKIVWDNRTKD